jgi:NifB/MoaA-like Fe-S oxidoreductase
MGLHTGTAELRDGDYYGSVLNRAARLMSVAHGGQVLISQALATLVADRLPEGLALRDLIDWWWATDGLRAVLAVERGPERRTVTLERSVGEVWGVSFAGPVFDRVRTCRNDCAFCFISQLPPGLRSSHYLRDDDFRLSFLSGTFITLTNLTDADIARIVMQHLGPLHVSLHAVTPAVRAGLLRAHGEDRGLERFDELISAGIQLHVQIVLVPGVNEAEIPLIAERAATLGVNVMNITPLIAQGEFAGVAPPTPKQIHAMRGRCASHLPLISHCRQCRSDACGLLGEDRDMETEAVLAQVGEEYCDYV